MTYLLDTTAFSDLMREHPKMDARLAGLPPEDRVVICSVVLGEIRYGIGRLPQGKQRQDLEAKADRLLVVTPCEPVPQNAADHYAKIKLTREHQGLALDENDLWIAATCMVLGAVLVSRDRDFEGIDGLTVENWLA